MSLQKKPPILKRLFSVRRVLITLKNFIIFMFIGAILVILIAVFAPHPLVIRLGVLLSIYIAMYFNYESK